MSKRYIDLINAVSHKINGKDADTFSRPTKIEIGDAVNDTEKMMVLDRPQYNFLRKTAQINVWKPGTGVNTVFPGAPTGNPNHPAQNTDGILIAGQDYYSYYIEPFTCGAVRPNTIRNVEFWILVSNAVTLAKMNGAFKAYIIGVAQNDNVNPLSDPTIPNGAPDINNKLATSTNTISIVDDVGSDGNDYSGNSGVVKMQFAFGDTFCVGTGQKVYMAIEWHSTAYNGRDFKTLVCTGVPSTDSWFIPSSGILQQTYPGGASGGIIPPGTGHYFFKLTTTNAVYSYKDVSLPSDCRMPIRAGLPGSNFLFLPTDPSQAMFKQFSCPISTFFETGLDASGNKTITFNMQYDYNIASQPTQLNYVIPQTPYLLLDYIASAGVMVNDIDVPIVPQDFVEALEYGAMVKLWAENNGLPYNPETYEKQYLYVVNQMNMIVQPQRSVAVSINTGSYTSTMAAVRGSVNSNSLYTAYWPNSWAHIYFAALGNGITSQG
jgi:hypothetical protein